VTVKRFMAILVIVIGFSFSVFAVGPVQQQTKPNEMPSTVDTSTAAKIEELSKRLADAQKRQLQLQTSVNSLHRDSDAHARDAEAQLKASQDEVKALEAKLAELQAQQNAVEEGNRKRSARNDLLLYAVIGLLCVLAIGFLFQILRSRHERTNVDQPPQTVVIPIPIAASTTPEISVPLSSPAPAESNQLKAGAKDDEVTDFLHRNGKTSTDYTVEIFDKKDRTKVIGKIDGRVEVDDSGKNVYIFGTHRAFSRNRFDAARAAFDDRQKLSAAQADFDRMNAPTSLN